MIKIITISMPVKKLPPKNLNNSMFTLAADYAHQMWFPFGNLLEVV